MSEVLSIDDPEPPSTGANLLKDVPCGHNLNRPADIEAFKTAVAGRDNQNIGKQVVFVASDYFLIQPGVPSHDWQHVVNDDPSLVGELISLGQHDVTYNLEDLTVDKYVVGAVVEVVRCRQQIYIPAEDTRHMSLVRNS